MSKKYTRSEYGSYKPNSPLTQHYISTGAILPEKKNIKVVRDNGVFAFIVKEDFKHFKKGDILKPAGYNAPALNQPRGNVLTGNYMIQWTGPLYMDSQRRLR